MINFMVTSGLMSPARSSAKGETTGIRLQDLRGRSREVGKEAEIPEERKTLGLGETAFLSLPSKVGLVYSKIVKGVVFLPYPPNMLYSSCFFLLKTS